MKLEMMKMTIKTYNVAKATNHGVEIIQLHPYLTKNEVRKLRILMKRFFPMNNYVVINLPTYLGYEEEFKLP